jgi:hypothetical protein
MSRAGSRRRDWRSYGSLTVLLCPDRGRPPRPGGDLGWRELAGALSGRRRSRHARTTVRHRAFPSAPTSARRAAPRPAREQRRAARPCGRVTDPRRGQRPQEPAAGPVHGRPRPVEADRSPGGCTPPGRRPRLVIRPPGRLPPPPTSGARAGPRGPEPRTAGRRRMTAPDTLSKPSSPNAIPPGTTQCGPTSRATQVPRT